MNHSSFNLAQLIATALPVLKFTGATGPHWMRNVKSVKDPRRGPWLKGEWTMLDEAAWNTKACVYFLLDSHGDACYVGKSTAKLQTRWKLCPALDARSGDMLPKEQRQMFHSQCWGPMMDALHEHPENHFELRVLPQELLTGMELPFEIEPSLPLVDQVEQWLLDTAPEHTFPWNQRTRVGC